MFNWQTAFNRNKLKMLLPLNYLDNSFLRKTLFLNFIIIIFCLFKNIKIQGFEISNFIFNFYESSNQYMSKRYSEKIVVNIYSQIANIFNYANVILGGVLIGVSKGSNKNKKKTKIAFYSLLPSLLMTLTQAAKGTVLLTIVLFYGGILITRIFNNKFELTNKKTNKVFIIVAASIFLIMSISFMSRGLYKESFGDASKEIILYFNSYSFAHIYAFSDWFSFYLFDESKMRYQNKELSYGFYTFMSLFKALGSKTIVPLGVYGEYFNYKEIIKSNIYTVFRGNILDFGIIGSFIFWFFAGMISNCIYYLLLSLKKPIVSISLFAMMLGYFYTSFIISLFIWKSIFASVVVLSLIFLVNKFKSNNLL